MNRAMRSDVASDLGEKMDFVGGPRQVGRTTLALSFLESESESDPCYLNWDHRLCGGVQAGRARSE